MFSSLFGKTGSNTQGPSTTKNTTGPGEVVSRPDGRTFGSQYSRLLIQLNLFGEMLYVLAQRLQAQSISEEKGKKVLSDIIAFHFSEHFVQQLLKPQPTPSEHEMRAFFHQVVHSSSMKLNELSMGRLYDLMLICVKRQILLCSSPNQILQATMLHMESMLDGADPVEGRGVVQKCMEVVLELYGGASAGQWMQLEQEFLRFMQGVKIKASLLLQANAQEKNGRVMLENTGRLPFGAELPGEIRYFDGGALSRIDKYAVPKGLQGACSEGDTVLDPEWNGGCSIYTSSGLAAERVPGRAADQLPEGLRRVEEVLMRAAGRQRAGLEMSVLSDRRLMARALGQGSKPWKRSKFSLLGQGRAGKTAFANALAGREFEETASTVGINQLTCDVKQVTSSEGALEWGERTSAPGREYELAVAHLVARTKQRAVEKAQAEATAAQASASTNIVAYMRTLQRAESAEGFEQDSAVGGEDSAGREGVAGHGSISRRGADEGGSGGPSGPLPTAATACEVPAEDSGEDGGEGEGEDGEGEGEDGEGEGDAIELEPAASPLPTAVVSSEAAEALDEVMVMKMLATMQDADTGLLISLFDFGGQSVFDVIHHLFLTRNGVYALVFNMEWLVRDGPEKDKALRFMRSWLSSIAVHTFNKTTQMTAPIVIVGTRLDAVSSPAEHAAISTLLYENFSDNIAWRSVTGNDDGRDSNGRAFQWFFPVDNRQGKHGAAMRHLMAEVHRVIDAAAYTHKEVPLAWFKAIDAMAESGRDYLPASEVAALCARCQVSAAEVPYLLAFLHDMGHLMWIDEPGLRDVVVLDPVSYLVTPATVIICKITPDNDDPTHHFMQCHRECERLHKREWKQLKQEGVLNVALLPILWKDYLQHREVLLQLMVKFGLLVPLRTASSKAGSDRPVTQSAAGPPAGSLYLVPTLLCPAPATDNSLVRWTDAPLTSSCHFVFTLIEELECTATLSASNLMESGFLPGGMFERIVGKALGWSQDTSVGGAINLHSVVLHKDLAVMAFGRQRFRLVNCADIHCVRVDVEGSHPLGVFLRLQRLISQIIEECMGSLRCFGAVRYSGNGAQDREDPADPLRKQLQPSELLIPLDQLRKAGRGESMLAWRGGRSLMSTEEVRAQYDQWLQLYELRERYDVFISYRWGQHDSLFAEKLFDMFTNYCVGSDLRAVHVFLDRKRLREGRQFKVDFAAALTHSLVAVPVVSVDALWRMLEHSPDHVDNVLLEWVIILECQRCGRLLKVYPALFGPRVVSLEVSDGSVVVTDFFKEGLQHRLPKVVPAATIAQAADLLRANGIQPSEQLRGYTVHAVVQELLQFMLCVASDIAGAELVETFAERVVRLLGECGTGALASVTGATKDTHPPLEAAEAALAQEDLDPVIDSRAGALKPLKEVSGAELLGALGKAGLHKAVAPLQTNGVTGKQLFFCEEYGELMTEDFGITGKPLARELMEQIRVWKAEGVTL